MEYRTAERGDSIFEMDVNGAVARNLAAPAKAEKKEAVKKSEGTTDMKNQTPPAKK